MLRTVRPALLAVLVTALAVHVAAQDFTRETIADLGSVKVRIRHRCEDLSGNQHGLPFTETTNATGGGVTKGTAGELQTLTIQTRDICSRNVRTGGNNFTIEIKHVDGTTLTPTISDPDDGTYIVRYQPTKSGNYSVSIDMDSEQLPIQGSPYDVFVFPAATYPARSSAGPPGDGLQSATAGAQSKFTIQARDFYNNNRISGNDTWKIEFSGPASISPSISDHANGTYTVTYDPLVLGSYTVTVKLVANGTETPIIGSGSTLTVQPGHVSPSFCTATGSGLGVATAGTVAQFTIQSRDRFNNTRTVGGDNYNVTLSGTSNLGSSYTLQVPSANISDQQNGQYVVSYVATRDGNFSLDITLPNKDSGEAEHINGSPFNVTAFTAVTDAAKTFATGSGLTLGTAGVAIPLTITARDRFENRITKGGDVFRVIAERNGGGATFDLSSSLTDNGNGIYVGSFTPIVAGVYNYTLRLRVDGAYYPIAGDGSQATIHSAATHENESVADPALAGNGLVNSTAGAEAFFTIQAKDSFGNNRPVGTDTFVASLTHKTKAGITVGASVSYAGGTSGQHRATYNATVSGEYTLRAVLRRIDPISGTITDSAIQGNGRTIRVYPDSIVPATTVASGISLATAGQLSSFGIQGKDRFANDRESGGDSFSVSLIDLARENVSRSITNVTDLANGAYTVTVNETVASKSYRLRIELQGAEISGSPYAFVVDPATTSAARSSVTEFASGTAGASRSTIITARDEFGNARTTGGETFRAQVVGPETVLVTAADRSDGTYNATLTVTRAGTYTFSALFVAPGGGSGAPVNGSGQTVTVVPNVISASKTNADGALAGSGLTDATAGVEALFTIQTKDEYGNDKSRSGHEFRVRVSGPATHNGSIEYAGVGTGRYSARYTATVAGSYSVKTELKTGATSYAEIDGSPSTATVRPNVINGSETTVTDSVYNATAGVSAQFVVEARDSFGNARSSGGDAFSINITGPSGAVACSGGSCPFDQGNGKYNVSYSSDTAGNHTISIALVQNGAQTAVKGSPFSYFLHPAATHATSSLMYGGGLTLATAGEPAFFTLQARDRFTNNRTIGGDSWILFFEGVSPGSPKSSEGTFGLTPTRSYTVTDLANGLYTIRYIADFVDTYKLNITFGGVGGEFVAQHQPRVVPGATSASKTTAKDQGITLATAGVQAQFTIQAKDAYENFRGTGGDEFLVNITGPFNTTGQVVDLCVNATTTEQQQRCGDYSVTYLTNVSGSYQIAVQLRNGSEWAHIKSSPFTVTVNPAATDVTKSTVSGTGASQSTFKSLDQFVIEARDGFGNRRTSGGDKFFATFRAYDFYGSSDSFTLETGKTTGDSGSIADLGDGSYRVQYRVQRTGQTVVGITGNPNEAIAGDIGQPIQDSPFNITVIGGTSCADIKNSGRLAGESSVDKVYYIDTTGGNYSDAYPVYCDMSREDGGWTLALKSHSNATTALHFTSTQWTQDSTLDPMDMSLTNDVTSKYRSFNELAFNQVMIDMDGVATVFTFPSSVTSLRSAFAGGSTLTATSPNLVSRFFFPTSVLGINEVGVGVDRYVCANLQLRTAEDSSESHSARIGLSLGNASTCASGIIGAVEGLGLVARDGSVRELASGRLQRSAETTFFRKTRVFVRSTTALVGSSQALAGFSCKDIDSRYGSTGDGTYWIDPNGGDTSDALQVLCDMTLHGGGLTRIASCASSSFSNYFTGTAATQLVRLASLSTQVHIRTTGRGTTEYATSKPLAQPITNLRNAVALSYQYASSQWTGPMGTDAHLASASACSPADPTYPGQVFQTCGSPERLRFGATGPTCSWNATDATDALEAYVGGATFRSCKDLVQNQALFGDASSGIYTIDPDGGDPSNAFSTHCDIELDGGGWTLIATNEFRTDGNGWTRSKMNADSLTFGPSSDADVVNSDFKSQAFYSLTFRDIMFTNGNLFAVYREVSDGTKAFHTFQQAITQPNCGTDDGQRFSLTTGNLTTLCCKTSPSQSGLCSTDLFFHVKDHDCGTCCGGYNTQFDVPSTGPAWSVADLGSACPLNDPNLSSFISNSGGPWGQSAPLRMYVR